MFKKENGPGVDEADIAAAGERQPVLFQRNSIDEQEPIRSEIDSRGPIFHGVAPDSSFIASNSRGRVSSANDYQSYLLQPKILHSENSSVQKLNPNLGRTQAEWGA